MEIRRDNRHVLFLALVGILAFVIAGVINGLILIRTEPPLGPIVEGVIWGLILGYFVRERFKVWKVVLAAVLANVISFFLGAFIGLSLPVPRFVTYMVMGLIMGLIFGGILGKMRGALLFMAIGAVVYLIGGFLFDTINVYGSGFLNFIDRTFGPNGWVVVAPALTGIFKGLAMGLSLGFYKERMK